MCLRGVFRYRNGGILSFFYTVSEVAKFLEVTDRRVRTLLSQGRISGFKDESDIWRVHAPLNIKPGKRGPDFRAYASRKLLPKRDCSANELSE